MHANTMRLKRSGLVVGVGALALLGALTLGDHLGNAGVGANLAGSGDAPTNTVYVSPAVSAMNLGSTETTTVAPSVIATSMAAPAVKAGG
jgi:hypothetical protein